MDKKISYKNTKPIKTANELVLKMKEKGISFNIVNEQDAEYYLEHINNYLRTASYRKNYQKYQMGNNQGKYIGLDFAYLKELSTLDMHFRIIVTQMCIDFEHDLKILILKEIEKSSNSDGYCVVKDFLDKNPKILSKIAATKGSSFTDDLLNKYFSLEKDISSNRYSIVNYDDCPIWVFLEFLTFGDLIYFYVFVCKYFEIKQCISTTTLNLVKGLRNGCAHNNCIFANFSRKTSKIPEEISQSVATIHSITRTQRQKTLTCRPVLEFTALIYAYNKIVSVNVKKHSKENLEKLLYGRMRKNWRFFSNNDLITNTYLFIRKILKFYLVK